jgi:hypothetical protein
MHPDIAGLVSIYYPHGLKSAPETRRPHGLPLPDPLQGPALLWLDTSALGIAAHERSQSNLCEAQLLRYAIHHHAKPYPQHALNVPPLAVLTPYKNQISALEQALSLPQGSVHTGDSFQGREAEVVLLSLVRHNSAERERDALGFLDAQRVNVLLSRARRLLVIAGSLKHFARFPETHWQGVAAYFRDNPHFVVVADKVGFNWSEGSR